MAGVVSERRGLLRGDSEEVGSTQGRAWLLIFIPFHLEGF